MHELFINYRVMTAKSTAFTFERVLTERFGPDSVFLAGHQSIDLGANYIASLVNKVRRCSVLLALVGPDWLDAPDPRRRGRRALNNPDDWVRRELEEAFGCGVLVVPVLIERHTDQLDARRLPKPIARLAECQFERFHERTADTDLVRLGDRLVQQVPELASLDKHRPAPDEQSAAPQEPTMSNTGQSGGIGNMHGRLDTYVHESYGPLHTGRGELINGPQFNGENTSYVAHSQGGNHPRFGSSHRDEEGER
ncbi:TIR domain-containing protein [Streptomyces sp. NPDC050617]|uniref:TIR domain-containing protein n=1 Tax=Streptomyces sp. NPDC050617 TaxID=3154628 RepID=UPI0034160E05